MYNFTKAASPPARVSVVNVLDTRTPPVIRAQTEVPRWASFCHVFFTRPFKEVADEGGSRRCSERMSVCAIECGMVRRGGVQAVNGASLTSLRQNPQTSRLEKRLERRAHHSACHAVFLGHMYVHASSPLPSMTYTNLNPPPGHYSHLPDPPCHRAAWRRDSPQSQLARALAS